MNGRRLGCLALIVALVASVAPQLTASASPVIPSTDQIAAAQQTASTRAQQVSAIKSQLASAQADLDRTQIAVQVAGQAYDAALLKLDAARATLRSAQAANRAAQRDVASAQRAVGALVRSQVQSDAGLLQWASLLNGASPQDLLDQASVFNTVSASLEGLKEKLAKAQAVADQKQRIASAAEKAVESAAEDAGAKKAAAEKAAEVAQDTVSSYASRRDELLTELASAEHVAVSLVKQRQAGLEALAKARAEAKRKAQEAALKRREAARRAAEVRAAEARAAAAARARSRARAAAAAEQERAARATHKAHAKSRSSSGSSRSSGSGSSGTPVSRPVSHAGSGYSAGAARAAIAYAERQLGKPYVFGATGPSTFDCSGLTMRAWEAAGRNIPRLAASQYIAIQHISAGDLRPGDLVFWGSSPGSIYHVAMYIGGGRIIQAPRPGRSVEIQSLYYWITPDYYGRV